MSFYLVHRHFFFYFYCHGHPRDLHSFPTRRSSDLVDDQPFDAAFLDIRLKNGHIGIDQVDVARDERDEGRGRTAIGDMSQGNVRSEEHTSELQSRENLVCRLLLEKKKKKEHK